MAITTRTLSIFVAFALCIAGCSGSSQSGTSPFTPQQTTQAKPSQAVAPRVPAANPTQNIPITGTAPGATFSGTFSVQRFVSQGRKLFAVGTLSGTLTNSTTNATIGTVTNVPVRMPVASADPTCPILSLTLGPLDLNLLGLKVHLNQIVLTITAQSAPGNLLGNLLCAIANLLNGGAPLGALAGLLNRILAILAGL